MNAALFCMVEGSRGREYDRLHNEGWLDLLPYDFVSRHVGISPDIYYWVDVPNATVRVMHRLSGYASPFDKQTAVTVAATETIYEAIQAANFNTAEGAIFILITTTTPSLDMAPSRLPPPPLLESATAVAAYYGVGAMPGIDTELYPWFCVTPGPGWGYHRFPLPYNGTG